MSKNTLWLSRRIAADGPYLALCKNEAEFKKALKDCNIVENVEFLASARAHATTHFLDNGNGESCAIICIGDTTNRSPIEIAGLLVHEAVHVWQEYASNIGERHPGSEQEAYAIQAISQELMNAFAKPEK